MACCRIKSVRNKLYIISFFVIKIELIILPSERIQLPIQNLNLSKTQIIFILLLQNLKIPFLQAK